MYYKKKGKETEMAEAMLNVRIDEELENGLKKIAAKRVQAKSDVVRHALQEFVRRENGLDEVRAVVAKRFAEGRLSFEQAVELLGYGEARKIAFFVENARQSLAKGLQ